MWWVWFRSSLTEHSSPKNGSASTNSKKRIDDKNLSNAFTKGKNEVTTFEKIIQVKADKELNLSQIKAEKKAEKKTDPGSQRIPKFLLSQGEVSMEGERKEKLPYKDKQMAEIQYQLGVTLTHYDQFGLHKYLDPEQRGINMQSHNGSYDNVAVPTGGVDPHRWIMGFDVEDRINMPMFPGLQNEYIKERGEEIFTAINNEENCSRLYLNSRAYLMRSPYLTKTFMRGVCGPTLIQEPGESQQKKPDLAVIVNINKEELGSSTPGEHEIRRKHVKQAS